MTNLIAIYEKSKTDPTESFETFEGQKVARQFMKDWDVSSNAPARPFIRRVCRIVTPPHLASFPGLSTDLKSGLALLNYQSENELQRYYNDAIRPALSTAHFRYHCTKRASGCQIGESAGRDKSKGIRDRFCSSHKKCPACNIMKTGFDLSKAWGTGKLGRGIYTTCSSLKADRYTEVSSRHKYKFMIVSWVSKEGLLGGIEERVEVHAETLKAQYYRGLEGRPKKDLRHNHYEAYKKIKDHRIFSHPETLHFYPEDVMPIYLVVYENDAYKR